MGAASEPSRPPWPKEFGAAVGQQPADGDVLFAGGGELGPVAGDRDVEVQVPGCTKWEGLVVGKPLR